MSKGVGENDGGINRTQMPSAGVKGSQIRTTPLDAPAIPTTNPINSYGVMRSYPGDSLGNYPAVDEIVRKATQFPQATPKPMTDQNGDPILNAAKQTFDWEVRKDKDGYPAVYHLGAADGGGSYEVAGINEKYDPMMAEKLKNMAPKDREAAAIQYIADNQKAFASQFPKSLQGFAVDMGFNRGAGGATKYLQTALNSLGQNVTVDSALGPKTLAAINAVDAKALMKAASDAQYAEEQKRAADNPGRMAYLDGLKNRIDNRYNKYSI